MKPFINPYLKPVPSFNGPNKNLYRAPASIDKDDYEFIKGLRPATGTVINCQNLLWQKLVQSLKDHGITDLTKRTEFEQFVANLNFVDGRGTTPCGDVAQINVGNDGRGTTGARNEPQVVKNISSNSKGKAGRATPQRRPKGK